MKRCRYCHAEMEDQMAVCPVCGEVDPSVQEEPLAAAAPEGSEPWKAPEAAPPAEETAPEETLPEEPAAEETAAEADPEEPVAEETAAEAAPEEEAPEEVDAEESAPEASLQETGETGETPAEAVSKKPKHKALRIVAAVLACTLLLGVLGSAIFYSVNGGWKIRKNDVHFKDSYTVSDEKAAAQGDKVIATMGDYQLTNGQLQIYYWMQFIDFVNYYGYYAPFDYTQPLDTQIYSQEDGTTWQQYFLDIALQTWQRYQVLATMAQEAGIQLDEAYQEGLESTPAQMEEAAQEAGYESAEEMLHKEMGAACTMDDYVSYLTLYYTGYQYFLSEYEKMEPTEEEVEAYYQEHQEEFVEQGLDRDGDPLVDVRHVLIQPEGGTEDENGNTTYSEEEWEACRKKAQELLDQWLAGDATESSFADMAYQNSADGSYENGGLYSQVYQGQMVEPFENWCFDESRQAGDSGLVRSEFGYHIMYFVGDSWFVSAKSSLTSQRADELLDSAIEQNPMKVNYREIILGNVDFGA